MITLMMSADVGTRTGRLVYKVIVFCLHRQTRGSWQEERSLNVETFGVGSVQRRFRGRGGYHRGYSRGGRGGRGRGGYRGGYHNNQSNYNGRYRDSKVQHHYSSAGDEVSMTLS